MCLLWGRKWVCDGGGGEGGVWFFSYPVIVEPVPYSYVLGVKVGVLLLTSVFCTLGLQSTRKLSARITIQ